MTVIQANQKRKSVGSPSYEYDSMVRQWRKCRAVLTGENAVKNFDSKLDRTEFQNLLAPFSPRMSDEQYKWYKSEAELPGLAAQYVRVLLGGLLRKNPELELPEETLGKTIKELAENWLVNTIAEDNNSLVTLMTDILNEQLTTTGGYISVDYPSFEVSRELTKEERERIAPFPILWKAEEVINVQSSFNPITGREILTRIVFRYVEKVVDPKNPFHPKIVPTAAEHYLDEGGVYRVQLHRLVDNERALVDVSDGTISYIYEPNSLLLDDDRTAWEPEGEAVTPKMHGKEMNEIPAWPLSGTFKQSQPLLLALIDKEVALYNKMSRRNHLLYGASSYTPVVFSDMMPEDFQRIVDNGLGSWMLLGKDDKIDTLTTPTEALTDLETAIQANLNELSVLGTRLLNPETDQPGVAISIKNSIQIAQLGMLNVQIGSIMRKVFSLLVNWRYDIQVPADDIRFELSADFDPSPTSVEWMTLITEWYQSRIIPRSVWLAAAKRHDVVSIDYDDEEGMTEIADDPLTMDQTYEPGIKET